MQCSTGVRDKNGFNMGPFKIYYFVKCRSRNLLCWNTCFWTWKILLQVIIFSVFCLFPRITLCAFHHDWPRVWGTWVKCVFVSVSPAPSTSSIPTPCKVSIPAMDLLCKHSEVFQVLWREINLGPVTIFKIHNLLTEEKAFL